MPICRSLTYFSCLLSSIFVNAAEKAPLRMKSLPPLPDAHGFAGCFAGVIGDELIVAGGANFPDGVMPWKGGKKVWHAKMFSLSLTNTAQGWKDAGSLPEANGYGISVPCKSGFIMIGGGDASKHFTTVIQIGKAEGKLTFTTLPSLPHGIANACGIAIDDQIHVVGGIATPDATQALKKHWVLDLNKPNDHWQEAPEIPGDGVMLATIGATTEGFIVSGGCSLSQGDDGKAQRHYLRNSWHFTKGAWQACADMPRAAVAAASPAWQVDGKTLMMGGDDGTQVGQDPEKHRGFSRSVLSYDPKSNKWQELGELENPLPVTLPAVIHQQSYLLISGEIRPGVRTPAVSELRVP